MRFWAVIISISLISCGFQPLLRQAATALNASTHSCCSKKKQEHCTSSKQEKSKDDCCMKWRCCVCCCVYLAQSSTIHFEHRLTGENHPEIGNENGLSSFSADCWHPPQERTTRSA